MDVMEKNHWMFNVEKGNIQKEIRIRGKVLSPDS